ncbi:hypothetical protein ACTVKE_14700 [Serratia marcescens]|uniref:hypothetical protein n=1 Tax=Serratia marcescens TaxID=615 RepID=UPI003FA7A940
MSLILPSRPLVVLPELAARIGLNQAIALQQIHYWLADTASGVEYNGRRWVYNTMEEWAKQFPFWSLSTVKRTFSDLERQGCIYVEQLSEDKRDMTNFYAINYQHPALSSDGLFDSSIGSNCTIPSVQIEPMHKVSVKRCKGSKRATPIGSNCTNVHTEITTESTSNIKPSSQVAAQPDDPSDEVFLSRHPEAVVFSARKKIWGSAEDLKCAEWIRSRIVKLYEQAAESDGEVARPKEPNWADWANEIRLMCSQDGRTHKQICELFAKANRDPFWCKNILSPSKLREKWDDLTLKLSVNPVSPAGGHWNTAEAWENTL